MIDRKATKNKKLRFKTFEPLENFMSAKENTNVLPDRDILIENLFGKGAQQVHQDNELKDIDLL